MRARPLTAFSAVALMSLVAASNAGALSCVRHEDVLAAAREAVAGDHPLWADSYIVGRVEAVERNGLEPVILTVAPTHDIGGEHPAVLRLAARQDGPPDPTSWRAGSLWFLALEESGQFGTDGFVSPCAPNFEVTDAAEIALLVASAPEVEIRDTIREESRSEGVPDSLLLAGAGALAVVLASHVAFRRRSG